MDDLSSDAENTDTQLTSAPPGRAIEPAGVASLMSLPDTADQRTELYTRLRALIDNATESVRALKDENVTLTGQNAELSERVVALEQRIRAVTSDLANDELALRKSAEVLEQVLKSTPAAPARGARVAAPAERPAPQPAESAPPVTAEHAPPAREQGAETPTIAQPEEPADMETTGGPEAPVEPETPEMSTPAAQESASAAPAARATGGVEGTYTLIAYPFVRFSDLGQFQASLQRLTGVHDVQVRRFAQGTLEMRLGYDGGSDLAGVLRGMETDIEDVQEEEPYRLRVRLRTRQDA